MLNGRIQRWSHPWVSKVALVGVSLCSAAGVVGNIFWPLYISAEEQTARCRISRLEYLHTIALDSEKGPSQVKKLLIQDPRRYSHLCCTTPGVPLPQICKEAYPSPPNRSISKNTPSRIDL